MAKPVVFCWQWFLSIIQLNLLLVCHWPFWRLKKFPLIFNKVFKKKIKKHAFLLIWAISRACALMKDILIQTKVHFLDTKIIWQNVNTSFNGIIKTQCELWWFKCNYSSKVIMPLDYLENLPVTCDFKCL